ncbi:glycosyltransferase family protein [Methanomassiliicoccus luminyensis]|uniref:glycosyltransferase n=1 Tax=Methanomassiliicoccus luminyensis TaxID=1080712 RepID=UPI000474F52A|nr:glycosyltransferase [Methanomassiliicoccus luminyensis]
MRLAQTFRTIYRDLTKKEMTSLPAVPPARGRALMGYLNAAVVSKEDSRLLRSGHTNRWECRNIAHIFSSFGYDVDAINWDNKKFLPSRSYNVHFDISTNMARFHSALPDTQRLLHVTESYPRFNNAAEARRVEEMERRTGVPYAPKRKMLEPDLFDSSLEIADRISLIGNEVTLSTFPERFRDRITLVTPSSSTAFIKPPKALVPPSREFLWFNGAGAVHKGLDLTLEAFRKLPDLRLNVVGNAHEEEDFMRAYGNDLLHAPNITYYGWLRTDGRVFREVMERCCCFISPSAARASPRPPPPRCGPVCIL